MTKYFIALLFTLSSCSPYYYAVVISKGTGMMGQIELEAKIDDYNYVIPSLTVNQWDSLNVGDKIIVSRKTFKLK